MSDPPIEEEVEDILELIQDIENATEAFQKLF